MGGPPSTLRRPVAASFLQQASLGIYWRNLKQKVFPLSSVRLISSRETTTSEVVEGPPSTIDKKPPPPAPHTPSDTTTTKYVSTATSRISSSFENILKHAQNMIGEKSGFIEIEKLKGAVQEASTKFDQATTRVSECRQKVTKAQKIHDRDHKKHVSLLMRREEWSPSDAASFVTITGDEVKSKQALVDAQHQLRRSEDDAIKCQHVYMDLIRQRYHEEQLWQDKWRLLATYGTWSLIGINTLVFLIGQYRAERRETKRLNSMEQILIKSQGDIVSAITNTTSAGDASVAALPPPLVLNTRPQSGKDSKSKPSSIDEEVVGIGVEAQDSRVGTHIVKGRDECNSTRTPTVARDNVKTDTDESADQVLPASRTDSPDETRNEKKMDQLLQLDKDILGFPIHTPSVALGAGITASVVIVVALLSGR